MQTDNRYILAKVKMARQWRNSNLNSNFVPFQTVKILQHCLILFFYRYCQVFAYLLCHYTRWRPGENRGHLLRWWRKASRATLWCSCYPQNPTLFLIKIPHQTIKNTNCLKISKLNLVEVKLNAKLFLRNARRSPASIVGH